MAAEVSWRPPADGPSLPGLAGGPRGVRRVSDLADNAVLVTRELLSSTVAQLVVRPDAGMGPFMAGQYLALGVRVADRVVQRPYSTASDPATADAHEFLVRRVSDGALTPRLWALPAGARVRLGPPKGTFTLVAGDQRPHLFVATGTGLAPFLGMLRTLARRPNPPRAVLIHGAARAEDLVCRDEIAALAAGGLPLAYVPTVSRPGDTANRGWRGRTGRAETVLESLLGSDDLRAGGFSAYLCGNPGMVAAAEVALLDHGVAPGDIHAERYWTAPGDTSASDRGVALV
jgi:ferredoxin-NADP reductase